LNFFEHQQQARSKTAWLLSLLVVAIFLILVLTLLLVSVLIGFTYQPVPQNGNDWLYLIPPDLSIKIAGVILCAVALAMLYKWLQLKAGGQAVAEALGGRKIQYTSASPSERKLLNVVEEMSIASGLVVPQVYVLEESAINAFAAGFSPANAVIGVTRGCIEQLDRSELQGVIAHEFSHIFNGDMRLNMRLISLLHGILFIGLFGRQLLHIETRASIGSRGRGRNSAPVALIGIGLICLGYTGSFFGQLIRSAVSRQREFLADASAVQFTRNPAGIANALKRIGGMTREARINHPRSAEFSHMFFGQAIASWLGGWMATHPPLMQRIRRLEPGWDGVYLTPRAIGISDASESPADSPDRSSGRILKRDAESLFSQLDTEQVGQMGDVGQAEQWLFSLPASLRLAAHDPSGAQAIVLSLFTSDTGLLPRGIHQLQPDPTQFLGYMEEAITQRWKAEDRLPLIELCLPALQELTPEQFTAFKDALIALITQDGRIQFYEWALYRVLMHHLESEQRSGRLGAVTLKRRTEAVAVLLSAMAWAGGDKADEAEAGFKAAVESLNLPQLSLVPEQQLTSKSLSIAVAGLAHLKPLQKPALLKAMRLSILHDNCIKPVEAEMMRAFSLSLDCPMPPLHTVL